jgi:hypothetical protein
MPTFGGLCVRLASFPSSMWSGDDRCGKQPVVPCRWPQAVRTSGSGATASEGAASCPLPGYRSLQSEQDSHAPTPSSSVNEGKPLMYALLQRSRTSRSGHEQSQRRPAVKAARAKARSIAKANARCAAARFVAPLDSTRLTTRLLSAAFVCGARPRRN